MGSVKWQRTEEVSDAPLAHRSLQAHSSVTEASLLDGTLVQQALRDILESAPFRASKQSQKLLRYVVQHSLTGEDNLLRERVIGTEVFGRSPDYDTANDPIVRARVAEVRKRLAQYYVSEAHRGFSVRIEIPPGSYRVRFLPLAEESAEIAPEILPPHYEIEEPSAPLASHETEHRPGAFVRRYARWMWVAAATTVLVAIAAIVGVHFMRAEQDRALRQFWSPAMSSSVPILIYTGTNVVYRFSPEFLAKYREAHHLPYKGPEFVVDLNSLSQVNPHNLTSSSNSYVTVGDISACAAIVTMLAQRNKPYQLRYAQDISAGDLHAAPTVLIGAFNNPWTLNVTEPLRFTFVHGDTIVDNAEKTKSWTVRQNSDGSTTDDYALVTRLLNPQTGQILLTAAGIGQYGTQAASEFLASSKRIATFAATAPKGWDNKNIQILLHVKVVDEMPGSVQIAATHYW